ncbi:hypothetical protein Pdca_22080 [Pseudonocardia autotrophica]|nr:hypothetical protein Pdca_22080 [Pseudonocardia autotrophica]
MTLAAAPAAGCVGPLRSVRRRTEAVPERVVCVGEPGVAHRAGAGARCVAVAHRVREEQAPQGVRSPRGGGELSPGEGRRLQATVRRGIRLTGYHATGHPHGEATTR